MRRGIDEDPLSSSLPTAVSEPASSKSMRGWKRLVLGWMVPKVKVRRVGMVGVKLTGTATQEVAAIVDDDDAGWGLLGLM